MEVQLRSKSSILLLFASMLMYCSEAGESVPFIAWSNQIYLKDLPSRPAGQIVDSAILKSNTIDRILKYEGNQVVVLFSFNQLSIDDISKYGGAYIPNSNGGRLESFKNAYDESASHLLLPMVEPITLNTIKERATGPVITYDNQWSLKLTEGQVNLVVVPLKLTSDRASSLSKADDAIKGVMDDASRLGVKYTAILTSDAPSKTLFSKTDEMSPIVSRHLLAAKEDNYSVVQFNEKNCSGLLYVTNITVHGNISVPYSKDWDTTGTTCKEENNATLVMSKDFTDSEVTSFRLSLQFYEIIGGNFWKFGNTSSVSYTLKDDTKVDFTFTINATETPCKYSFHCGDQILKNLSAYHLVTLKDFQVQLYGINKTHPKFARANDCVGFFTPGIWMGLVTTLILVMILYFGVSMLTSLTVMDQFDDPKGKTITVNVVD